jgi:formamidopyrimidine-DNA glycosylase
MPELPELLVYVEALRTRVLGRSLRRVRLASPFLLRSVDPPVEAMEGRQVTGCRRLGKRIVLEFDAQFNLVFHLMISGRFRWQDTQGVKVPAKLGLAAFDFSNGTLILTEAASRKQASLHVVRGSQELRAVDAGIEVLDCDETAFGERLTRENHTLKRALTDGRLFSGIGNAYSDEILHAVGLSPIKLTSRLGDDEIRRLHVAVRTTLATWIERLQAQFSGRFPGPGQVTAFRPQFAVHGKFGQPCPRCGAKVQRICYARNETNYCPACQTQGHILADRSLSRLLKEDWPRSLDQLE